MKPCLYRVTFYFALAFCLTLAFNYQTQAQTLIDPSNFHVGAGQGTVCQMGCAGDPNQIGSGGTIDVFQVSNNKSLTVVAPILLILSVPNDTVDNTATYFGAASGGVYTSLGVQFFNPFNSGSPVTGTANVAGTGEFANVSNNGLGLQANPGPVSGAFYGSMTKGDVYGFLNFTGGGGIDNSNNFSNFTLNDPSATSFGIYVIALEGGSIGANGLVNVTGLMNLPLGTFVDAFGESSNGTPYVVPFTEAGQTSVTTTTPEPASMLLIGTGLVAFGGMLRRKKASSAV